MKFKVLVGAHSERNMLFNVGDIVETEKPLDKMFKGRFERIEAKIEAQEAPISTTSAPEQAPSIAKGDNSRKGQDNAKKTIHTKKRKNKVK